MGDGPMPTDDWQDVMSAIKGEYVITNDPQKAQQGCQACQEQHFVTISGVNGEKVKWTNTDGDEFELTQDAEDPLKFTAVDAMHDVTVIPCIDANEGVCGV